MPAFEMYSETVTWPPWQTAHCLRALPFSCYVEMILTRLGSELTVLLEVVLLIGHIMMLKLWMVQQLTTPTSAQLTSLDVSLVCFPSEPGCLSFDTRTPHLCRECFFLSSLNGVITFSFFFFWKNGNLDSQIPLSWAKKLIVITRGRLDSEALR